MLKMSDSRTSNSLKTIGVNIFNQILTLGLSFVSRTVFLRVLSVDYLGISGLFGDILNMLTLADLGFGTAMSYSMYKPLADKDYNKLAGLVTFYKKLYRIIAIIITVIGMSLVPFLKYLVNTETEIPNLTLYYILSLANTVASYLVVYKTNVLHADQKGYILGKYTAVFNILRSICMIVFLILTRNYTVYLLVQVIFTYITNFFNSHIAAKRYPYINKNVKLPKEDTKGIFNNMGSVFLYKVAGLLINATDNTLISVLVSTTAVGYYSNYTMVVNKLVSVINIFFYGLTASIGNLIAEEGKERRYQIFEIMQSVSLIISTFCVTCTFFLIEDFITIWLGKEYVMGREVLWAIIINFYFSIILLPIWVFREATGLYQKTKFVMLITAAVNVVASIILGKIMGLAGIIFATSISRITTYFWYEPKLLFKEYFGKSCLVYFKGFIKGLCTTALVFLLVYLATSTLIVQNVGTFFLKAFIVGGISLFVVVMIYYRTEGFKILFQRAVNLLKNISGNMKRMNDE